MGGLGDAQQLLSFYRIANLGNPRFEKEKKERKEGKERKRKENTPLSDDSFVQQIFICCDSDCNCEIHITGHLYCCCCFCSSWCSACLGLFCTVLFCKRNSFLSFPFSLRHQFRPLVTMCRNAIVLFQPLAKMLNWIHGNFVFPKVSLGVCVRARLLLVSSHTRSSVGCDCVVGRLLSL